jgi:triosephosphate isomerase
MAKRGSSLRMDETGQRKPMALANWKMAMTISESLAFADVLPSIIGDLVELITIVVCPPFTALHTLSRAFSNSAIALGAQNLFAEQGEAHTGEISASLIADTGCKWVMLGHWEVRRRTGETDSRINEKLHAACQAGLKPILLVGERTFERGQVREALTARLPELFADCDPKQVAQIAVIYEPEWSIGAREPAPPDLVDGGCSLIRNWIAGTFGTDAAGSIRIIYGGSVTAENANKLLRSSDVDGLGAGRKGRDPEAFAEIIRLIAEAKSLTRREVWFG